MPTRRMTKNIASTSPAGRPVRKAAATARSAIASTFASSRGAKVLKRKRIIAKSVGSQKSRTGRRQGKAEGKQHVKGSNRAHEPTSPPTFRLFDLPQELVDMIYIQMLQDGQINILWASRDVYQRASQFIQNHGVCRISLIRGCTSRYGVHFRKLDDYHPVDEMEGRTIRFLTRSKPHTIRNLDICVSSQKTGKPQGSQIGCCCTYCGQWVRNTDYKIELGLLYDTLNSFWYQHTYPDTCRITMETDISEDTGYTNWLLLGMRRLMCFCHLTIEYAPRFLAAQPWAAPQTSKEGRLFVYAKIKKALEPAFGPATPVDGKSELGQGLQFQPLRYRKNKSAGRFRSVG